MVIDTVYLYLITKFEYFDDIYSQTICFRSVADSILDSKITILENECKERTLGLDICYKYVFR